MKRFPYKFWLKMVGFVPLAIACNFLLTGARYAYLLDRLEDINMDAGEQQAVACAAYNSGDKLEGDRQARHVRELRRQAEDITGELMRITHTWQFSTLVNAGG